MKNVILGIEWKNSVRIVDFNCIIWEQNDVDGNGNDEIENIPQGQKRPLPEVGAAYKNIYIIYIIILWSIIKSIWKEDCKNRPLIKNTPLRGYFL